MIESLKKDSGGERECETDNNRVMLPDSVSVTTTVAGGQAMKGAQCSHTTRLLLSL